jgi:hypothetical protein
MSDVGTKANGKTGDSNMAEFSFQKRIVHLDVLSDTYTTVGIHGGDQGQNTLIVSANYFPKKSEEDREEFFTLALEGLGKDRDERFTTDSVTMFLDRETLERICFAAGELLAQSEGIAAGAAGARVVCDPRDENPETNEAWAARMGRTMENGSGALSEEHTIRDLEGMLAEALSKETTGRARRRSIASLKRGF